MEPWEDELLLDDDFSEEEEDAEEQIEKTSLEMDADGFADWEDASDGAPVMNCSRLFCSIGILLA